MSDKEEILSQSLNESNDGDKQSQENKPHEIEETFVPLDHGNAEPDAPMVKIRRKATLMKSQIPDVSEQEFEELLKCGICHHVVIDPKECSKCRSSFCFACINATNYQTSDGNLCPIKNCNNFVLIDAHPLLMSKLMDLTIQCHNSDKGCKEVLQYKDVKNHDMACMFSIIKCANFGCEEQMDRAHFDEHKKLCKYRVNKCEQCETMLKDDEDHDCIKSMKERFELVEKRLLAMAAKVEFNHKKIMDDTTTHIARHEIDLPALKSLTFDPQYGLGKVVVVDNVNDLPPTTRALIVKFSLTDINLRRKYNSITIQQGKSQNVIDLTNYFMVSQQCPSFGSAIEVIMPWDSQLAPDFVLTYSIDGSYTMNQQYQQHGHHDQVNPYAFASISIVGFFYM